jgi:hypothetical protein
MELADLRLIKRLLVNAGQHKGPRSNRSPGPRVHQAPAQKTRRCRCGVCAGCKDNARWERIFAEKFADPTYYSGPVIRYESPLHKM